MFPLMLLLELERRSKLSENYFIISLSYRLFRIFVQTCLRSLQLFLSMVPQLFVFICCPLPCTCIKSILGTQSNLLFCTVASQHPSSSQVHGNSCRTLLPWSDCAREQQKYSTGKCKIMHLAMDLYLLGKISHGVTQFSENTSSIAIIKQMKLNCSERTREPKQKHTLLYESTVNPHMY